MSRNALAALGAALLVLLALPTIGAAKNPNSVLNGVYRVQYTEKELVALGTTARYARDNAGVSTWTLKDGRYRWLTIGPRRRYGCSGPYEIRGKRIVVDFNFPPDCTGSDTATWTLRKGWLRLHVIVATLPGDVQLLGSKPWKKIG